MDFHIVQLQVLDTKLDRYHIAQLGSLPQAKRQPISSGDLQPDSRENYPELNENPRHMERIKLLESIVAKLSISSGHIQTAGRLNLLLKKVNLPATKVQKYDSTSKNIDDLYESELEWILLSKTTLHTYGILLNFFVNRLLALSEDLDYWDEVLASQRSIFIYWLQTFPKWIFQTSQDIFLESFAKFSELRTAQGALTRNAAALLISRPPGMGSAASPAVPLLPKESSLYKMVKHVIQERPFLRRIGALSPLAITRDDIRQRQTRLLEVQETQAAAIGILIGECLEIFEENNKLPDFIIRTAKLMTNILENVYLENHSVSEFEEKVFTMHPNESIAPSVEDGLALKLVIFSQLRKILNYHLPSQSHKHKNFMNTFGRPGLLTRYWLPSSLVLLCSTTVLRTFFNHHQDVQRCFCVVGATVSDFWKNWVMEPTFKVLGIIRHSNSSDVALMGRKSLEADMSSLQRMVVDFTFDNVQNSPGLSVSREDIESVRQNVLQGDLTPVLRAYEHDLRSPLRGAIRGELIRALLIQIQKTKVDVEVVISGVDRLLKSQELVFGFIGLTPGVIITLTAVRWLASLLKAPSVRLTESREQFIWRLRNIDKILTASTAMRGENGGFLNYREQGFLHCEVHVLKNGAKNNFKTNISDELKMDLDELIDLRSGVQRQIRVVDRIKWLSCPRLFQYLC